MHLSTKIMFFSKVLSVARIPAVQKRRVWSEEWGFGFYMELSDIMVYCNFVIAIIYNIHLLFISSNNSCKIRVEALRHHNQQYIISIYGSTELPNGTGSECHIR